MEDFGYVKDKKKKELPIITRKIFLSCATLFSISCFIYITISAYNYVHNDQNANVETIKSPEGPIKVVEEDKVAIAGEGPKINDSIYEDIFGNKKESIAKNTTRIHISPSPSPALPPKELATNDIIAESAPAVDNDEVVATQQPAKKSEKQNEKQKAEKKLQSAQGLIVYNENPKETNASQDFLSKGKVETKTQTRNKQNVSDQNQDRPKNEKRRYIRVQIAALNSKNAAEEYWKKISGSRLFSGLKPFTEEVNLGKRGIFYRLQVGNFSDQVEGEDFCKKYITQSGKTKADCIVVE